MTLPGERFVIRRKAYAMVKKAFDENGVKFALPTGQVASGVVRPPRGSPLSWYTSRPTDKQCQPGQCMLLPDTEVRSRRSIQATMRVT
jgi:hypothetical protein